MIKVAAGQFKKMPLNPQSITGNQRPTYIDLEVTELEDA